MKISVFVKKAKEVLGEVTFFLILWLILGLVGLGIIGGNLYMFSSKTHHKVARVANFIAASVTPAPAPKPVCRMVRVVNLTGGDVCLFETDNETKDGKRSKVLLERMVAGSTSDILTRPILGDSKRYMLFAQGGGFLVFGGEIKGHQYNLERTQAEQVWEIK